MKKTQMRQLLLPLAMAAPAVYAWIAAGAWKGAGIFPRMCAGLMFTGCAVTALQILLGQTEAAKTDLKGYLRAFALPLMIVIYIRVMPVLGYLPATAVLCASVMLFLGYRSWKYLLLSTAAGTLLIYVLFKIILKVPLP